MHPPLTHLNRPASPNRAIGVQAALGAKAKPGPHVVFVEKGGQKFAVGTLEGGRCPQFSCDITFAMDEVRSRLHSANVLVVTVLASMSGGAGRLAGGRLCIPMLAAPM